MCFSLLVSIHMRLRITAIRRWKHHKREWWMVGTGYGKKEVDESILSKHSVGKRHVDWGWRWTELREKISSKMSLKCHCRWRRDERCMKMGILLNSKQNAKVSDFQDENRLIFVVSSGRFQNLFWKKERFRLVVTATIHGSRGNGMEKSLVIFCHIPQARKS